MKKIIYLLSISLVAFSCSDGDSTTEEITKTGILELNSNVISIYSGKATKANTSNKTTAIDKSNFIVDILICDDGTCSTGGAQYKSYKFSELPNPLSLPIGYYWISLHSTPNTEFVNEIEMFAGDAFFEITENQTTNVNVNITPNGTGYSVAYSTDVINNFPVRHTIIEGFHFDGSQYNSITSNLNPYVFESNTGQVYYNFPHKIKVTVILEDINNIETSFSNEFTNEIINGKNYLLTINNPILSGDGNISTSEIEYTNESVNVN